MDARVSVESLTMMADEYFRFGIQLQHVACRLADLGVVPTQMPPKVNSRDTMIIVRFKEQQIACLRGRKKIEKTLREMNASILDENSFEIVMSGGPQKDSVLSWQPGEKDILYWRETAQIHSPRKLLPGVDIGEALATMH